MKTNKLFGAAILIAGIMLAFAFTACRDKDGEEEVDSSWQWTAVQTWPFGGSSGISAIAYGGGKFVAADYNGKMAYSANGESWTAVDDSPFHYNNGYFGHSYSYGIYAIAYGSDGNAVNKWVAGGSGGKLAYSSDGETWTAVDDSPFSDNNGYSGGGHIYAIAYSGGKFVAVGYGDNYPSNNQCQIAYSSNGEDWTAVEKAKWPFIAGSYDSINAIAYGDGKFVAGGSDGRMAYSTDGENWTAVANSTFGYDYIEVITYGGDRFVAAVGDGSSVKIAYSTDGVTWTAVSNSPFGVVAGSKYDSGYESGAIAYGNGRFVGVATYYYEDKYDEYGQVKMAYSSDGASWTTVSSSTFDKWYVSGIAYGGGRFVVVGDSGGIAYADW